MQLLDETPTSILQKKIDTLTHFADSIKKEHIPDADAEQKKKLESLLLQVEEKTNHFKYSIEILKKICPHCQEGILELVKGIEPYSTDKFQCSHCDSTFHYDKIFHKNQIK